VRTVTEHITTTREPRQGGGERVPASRLALTAGLAAAAGLIAGVQVTLHRQGGARVVVALAAVALLAASCASLAASRRTAREARTTGADERLLASILDQAHDPIMILDRVGRARFSNSALAALVGETAAREAAANPLLLLHRGDHEAMLALRRRLLADPGGTATVRCRLRRADGTWTQVEVVGTNQLGDPVIAGFVVTIRDVGEMLDHMERIARSERRARFLADNAGEVLVQADASGRIRYATPSSTAVLDAPPEDLVGTQLVELFHREDQANVRAALSEAVQRRGARQLDVRTRDAHRGSRWLTATIRSLIDTGGPAGLVEFHVGLRDVTAARRSAEALAASEGRLRTLVETAPIGIFETDLAGRFTLTNAANRAILGVDAPHGLLGGTWLELAHPDDEPQVRAAWSAAIGNVASFHERFRARTPGGATVWVEVHSVPLADGSGAATGFLGTVSNITHEHLLREELAASAARFRGMADGATDVIYRLRLDALAVEYVNPAVEEHTGVHPSAFRADALGTIRRVIHPDDLALVEGQLRRDLGAPHLERVQLRWVHVDGTITWAEHHFAVERGDDGTIVAVDAIARDITAIKRTEQELRDLAHQDPLTGLPNRRAGLELLDLRLAAGEPVVAMFVDLDGFKEVNDRWGHDVGDQILVGVGRRLAGCVRSGDTVVRLAGDEFLVLTSPEGATPLAERVLDELQRPFAVAEGVARLSASIGAATARAGEDPDELLRRADLAMYGAKRAGKGRVCVG